MNPALERLAAELQLSDPQHEQLALSFCLACAERVRHLLEDPEVVACLDVLADHLAGRVDRAALQQSTEQAAQLANRHSGSKSIDGCGHAAVSASYAVSKAVNGQALQAASYAAYAIVYAGGGTAAVAEREAFEPEYAWQLDCLRTLRSRSCAAA